MAKDERCSGLGIEDPTLPAIPAGRVKRSRAGRWRAAALILVHVLIAVHVGHWLATGSTMTPLEPSEAMQFTKEGIVNAGLILFALAIASTLVLGRWFCGWACHVVALQDLCRWLLLKAGIRPREVRLGLLGVVPWLAFAYMFLAPAVHRLLGGESLAPRSVELTTADFWKTFPGPAVAILTFACCGFAIVYLLGSKAFCTYGCPYGGIFGLVDQLAPMRIRVTDACEGCGHCTATCSSNVRVHQEVRDYGAVVDPGCMKCLDCVSVCPKDALYVGFGAPAILTRPRAPARPPLEPAKARRSRGTGREAFLRTLLLALFIPAVLFTLMDFDRWTKRAPVPLDLLWILCAGSLLVAVVFRGKAQRAPGYSLAEDALLAGLFVAALWTFRGFGNAVPLLFAFGLSAMLAFLAVQALRLLLRGEVRVANLALRRARRWTKPGIAFAAMSLPLLGAWGAIGRQRWIDRRDTMAANEAYGDGYELARRGDAQGAIAAFRRAIELQPQFVEATRALAGLYCGTGRLEEGVALYERALELDPDDATTHALAGQVHAELGRLEPAIAAFRRAVELKPQFVQAIENLAGLLCEAGRYAEGVEQFERALELNPDDPETHELAARAYAELGQDEEVLRHRREAAQLRQAAGSGEQ